MRTLDFSTDYKGMFDRASAFGARYLINNLKVDAFIIGLSGGIDSAMTAALARAAIDRGHRQEVRLIGYSLPILTNQPDEVSRARATGSMYCDHFTEVLLDAPFMDLIKPMDNALHYSYFVDKEDRELSTAEKIRIGNLKARLRMMYLYDKAQKYKGLVLSTDNFTEFLLGFWTLHGDVGDFGFIQEMWKTEVYGMAEWRGQFTSSGALLDCVDAKPTDGLGVSDSDLSQLLPQWTGGYREGYKEVDEVLQHWLTADGHADGEAAFTQKVLADHSVIRRHTRTEFKRNNPINIPKRILLGLD